MFIDWSDNGNVYYSINESKNISASDEIWRIDNLGYEYYFHCICKFETPAEKTARLLKQIEQRKIQMGIIDDELNCEYNDYDYEDRSIDNWEADGDYWDNY